MMSANYPNGYAVSPNPRTLLLPDPEAIPSITEGRLAPISGAIVGAVGSMAYRHLLRRPLFSGIQFHIAATLIAGGAAYIMAERKKLYDMDRDAVFRHYIELHPEDFPPPQRKKVGEVFQTFNPIR